MGAEHIVEWPQNTHVLNIYHVDDSHIIETYRRIHGHIFVNIQHICGFILARN